MLCQHLGDHGTTPDGRLFRGARGGILSESVYGRVWHAARQAALGPDLAATGLARRPYDLRHAALSLWLNASGTPAGSRPGDMRWPDRFRRNRYDDYTVTSLDPAGLGTRRRSHAAPNGERPQ
jgi:integrase